MSIRNVVVEVVCVRFVMRVETLMAKCNFQDIIDELLERAKKLPQWEKDYLGIKD